MSEGLKNTIIFTVGAAIGSAVTWKILKTKYEQIANEEIESVKEVYREKMSFDDSDEDESEDEPDEEIVDCDVKKLVNIISNNGYSEEEVNENMGKPYVISPDEYDENDYETETLYYYPDGVLTDMYNNIITNVEGTIGKKSLTRFGEYEDDSVFVRNDELETDYEILLQPDNYKDGHEDE